MRVEAHRNQPRREAGRETRFQAKAQTGSGAGSRRALGDDGSPPRTRGEEGLLSTRVTPDASSMLQHRKLQMRKAGLVEGTLSLLSQPSKQALLLTDCVNLAAVSLLTLEGISDSLSVILDAITFSSG